MTTITAAPIPAPVVATPEATTTAPAEIPVVEHLRPEAPAPRAAPPAPKRPKRPRPAPRRAPRAPSDPLAL